MTLDHDICYRALRTRDARFDGRFFTGVRSTGIYCRPVCPARTPKAANCAFFACAAAAEEAGFRACLRCRPETAPGTPVWRGTSASVARALRLIGEGALDDGSVEDLAARLGIGDRYLRRLFTEQLGASPLAVAQTRRVHLARQLIAGSRLPMGQIALAAGFHNVRRFNAAIRRSFDRTPTEIRRAAGSAPATAEAAVHLRLGYRPPLDWPGLLAFLAPRLIPGVEAIAGDEYRRAVALDEFRGVIRVRPDGARHALSLTVPVAGAAHLGVIAGRVRGLFDLDADPALILPQLEHDPVLAPLAAAYPGVRIPGAWEPFEIAVRAVLGQQVTVKAATRLSGRLVERFGIPLEGQEAAGPHRLFPPPERLARASIDDIAGLGMPGARAECLRGLARAVLEQPELLRAGQEPAQAVRMLTALPGVGDWTAQYIALRVLGEPDALPAGDLGVRKALAAGGKLPPLKAVRAKAEAWRPWRGYAAMLLWRGLTATGEKRA